MTLQFPVSGVEVNPIVPFVVAFLISATTAPAGVSGAFLLLPFQVSVLGFSSPAVSPTNLIYNVFAAPGGIYRYTRERRVVRPLAWAVVIGALPGVFLGATLRVSVFADPGSFKAFVGLVLLYLGGRLLVETFAGAGQRAAEGAVVGDVEVRTLRASLARAEYAFGGKRFSFDPRAVFLLSFAVGVVGGVYSIGGGAIIAPFLVTFFGLPVYTVGGAAMVGTFVSSVVGIGCFHLLDVWNIGGGSVTVAPDWLLGTVLGAGGLAGTYAGARLQKFLPDRWIKAILGLLVAALGLSYVGTLF